MIPRLGGSLALPRQVWRLGGHFDPFDKLRAGRLSDRLALVALAIAIACVFASQEAAHGQAPRKLPFQTTEPVRLSSGGGSNAKPAEYAVPGPFRASGPFALTLRMRVLNLGTEDDSTEKDSFLTMTVGAETPSGRYGVKFLFTADRYKSERRYKVLRTDKGWHEWRMVFDPERRTVALYRDGEYVCLHDAGSVVPPGIRIRAVGSAKMEAAVEFASISLEDAAPENQPLRVRRVAPRPIEPGEWPQWRRDSRNTALSPMKGDIRQPKVVWSVPVGQLPPQPVFLDLDGDRMCEALVSHGGNLTAFRMDGSALWKLRAQNATVHGVFDLDGDGAQDLIVTYGSTSALRILDPKSGRVRFSLDRYPLAGVAGVRVAKMVADGKAKGLQAIVWSPQHEIGMCLDFEEGVERARVKWEFNWRVTNFSPAVVLADMDRDGALDVIVNTYDRTFVFDGRNGKTKMDLKWPAGRNYGTTVVKDIDGDGFPDVVTLADSLREHLAVLKNEGGKSLRMLWDHFYEQNYPDDHKSLRVATESPDDFDGDGSFEIAMSLYDGTTDRRWHTYLLDALTGKTKATIEGRYLVGAGRFGAGTPPLLFLCQPSDRLNLNLSRIEAWTWSGGTSFTRLPLPEGTLLTSGSFRTFPLNAWSTTLVNSTVVRPLAPGAAENGVFLASTGAEGATVRHLTWADLERSRGMAGAGGTAGPSTGSGTAANWSVTVRASRSAASDLLSADSPRAKRAGLVDQTAGRSIDVAWIDGNAPEPQVVTVGADGAIRGHRRSGGVLGPVRAETGFVTLPVVATLSKGSQPSVLFQDPNGRTVCYRSERAGEAPAFRWDVEAMGSRPRMVSYADSQGIPLVAELGGSGDRAIYVAKPPDRIAALDADGKEVRSYAFPSLPLQWAVGRFDDDDVADIFATWPTGAYLDVRSGVVSGKDGKLLWQAHCGNGPPAVFDIDGDGRDDVLLRDLFERRTLRATDGRDIHPITMWAGYHIPVVLPLSGRSAPPGVAWVGGTYSVVSEGTVGSQSWWRPFRPAGPQAAADTDGDGRFEIGGVTAGQLYNWPRFYAVGGPNEEFVCSDALTGKTLWTYPLGTNASGVIAADVDGDGKLEFVAGLADGRLVALRGGPSPDQRLLWEIELPAAVGPPIVCDPDGTGKLTILAGCADGRLYAIR